MMRTLAYTIGNKNSYDRAFSELERGEIPELKKLGRIKNLNGEYYSGGCCWKTYKEARAYIDDNSNDLPFEADVYAVILPSGWHEDVSDDTYNDEGFYSLLVDAHLGQVDKFEISLDDE